jgi:hypothetical protein
MKDCEKYKALIVGLMDNELTPEEIHEVNAHLMRCGQCREEYEQLKETTESLNTMSFDEPQDEVLRKFWKSPYSRWARVSGMLLIAGGWLVLMVYGLIEMIRDNSEPPLPRIGIAAMIIGFFVLLIMVIRERAVTYQSDPYKEIER